MRVKRFSFTLGDFFSLTRYSLNALFIGLIGRNLWGAIRKPLLSYVLQSF